MDYRLELPTKIVIFVGLDAWYDEKQWWWGYELLDFLF
jgi:hypothetical protein